jgi:hypothetical protein
MPGVPRIRVRLGVSVGEVPVATPGYGTCTFSRYQWTG